jgi:hypothetical protein
MFHLELMTPLLKCPVLFGGCFPPRLVKQRVVDSNALDPQVFR